MSIRWRCIPLTLAVFLLLCVMTRHMSCAQNTTSSASNSTSGGGGGAAAAATTTVSGGGGTTGSPTTTSAPGNQGSTLASAMITCSVGLIMACLL